MPTTSNSPRSSSLLALCAGAAMAAAGLTLIACSSTTGGGGMSSDTVRRDVPPPGDESMDLAARIQADVDAARAALNDRPATQPAYVPPTATRRPDPVVTEGSAPAANIGPALTTEDPVEPTPTVAETGSIDAELTNDEMITRLAGDLAARLRDRASTEQTPFGTLAALATLDLVTPGLGAPPESGVSLTPTEDRALTAWRTALAEASSQFHSGGGPEALEGVATGLRAALDAERPLDIRQFSLCTRVEGFGQYAEFASTSFLARRQHRAIVYVEVDHFSATPASGPEGQAGFQVALVQGVSLYHADGTLAWRQTDQETADFSRNQRRDFFVVQRIELPETLTVGSYNLKVTMRDKATGAVAERTLPITIVADAALTRPAN